MHNAQQRATPRDHTDSMQETAVTVTAQAAEQCTEHISTDYRQTEAPLDSECSTAHCTTGSPTTLHRLRLSNKKQNGTRKRKQSKAQTGSGAEAAKIDSGRTAGERSSKIKMRRQKGA
eukprot:scaffold36285_cov119-Isochrysis_galbana.AAC.10